MKLSRIAGISMLLLLVLNVTSIFAEVEVKTYIVGLQYSNGSVNIESVIVSTTFFVQNESDGSYELDVISFNNKILYSTKFDFQQGRIYDSPPGNIFDETGKQIIIPEFESIQDTNDAYIELYVPYFHNGKELRVYDSSRTLLAKTSIAHFADLCGDNICQESESYESCPSDCLSGSADDYCDRAADKICDPDCAEERDVDCLVEGAKLFERAPKAGIPSNNLQLFLTLIGIIGIIVTVVVIFARIRAKEEEL